MATIPPPLPSAYRPKPPGMGSGQKALVALAIVISIALVASFAALIWWVPFDAERSEPESGFVHEAKQRQAARLAAHRDALAKLPPGTLPADWSCEDNIDAFAENDNAFAVSLADAFFEGGNQFLPLDCVELARTFRAKYRLTDFEKSIDPRTHTPDEMEKALLEFLRGSADLKNMAAAAGNGLYYVESDPTVPEWDLYDGDGRPEPLAPARLLNVRALLEARWGTVDDAVQSYLDAVRFAELVGSEPYLSNYWRRYQIEWFADMALWELLVRTDVIEDHIAAIESALTSREDTGRLKELAIEDVELAFARTMGEVTVNNTFLERMFSIVGAYDETKTRETAQRLAALIDAPYAELDEAVSNLDDQPDAEFLGLGNTPRNVRSARRLQLLSTLTRPLIGVVLALKQYKAEHGAYPAVLDELMPNYIYGLPNDPVTLLPTEYMTWDNGYFLFRTLQQDADSDSQYDFLYGEDVFEDSETFSSKAGYRRPTLWHARQ